MSGFVYKGALMRNFGGWLLEFYERHDVVYLVLSYMHTMRLKVQFFYLSPGRKPYRKEDGVFS